MNLSIWNLKDAKGQELDRLAEEMGYKRERKLFFKEEDDDFKDRLITLLQDYICNHEDTYYSSSLDTHVCEHCEKEVYRERRTFSRSAKRFRVAFEMEVDAETKEEALNQTIDEWDTIRNQLQVRIEEVK